MSPGLHPDLPNADYHASGALTSTGVKELLHSGAHYQAYIARELVETDAMRLGRLIHTGVLEPEKYAPAVWAGGRKGTKAYKEWAAENAGREIITQAEADTIEGIRAAVRAHPIAAELVNAPGMVEASLFAQDETRGIMRACRPDKWVEQLRWLVDLKSAEDASPHGFARAAANYGYDVSAAWYLHTCKMTIEQAGLDLEPPEAFVFVAVEKVPPYAVGVYTVGQDVIESGRAKVREALELFDQCTASGHWPAYGDEIQTLKWPRWAMQEVA